MTECQIRTAIQAAIKDVLAEKPLLDFQHVHERSIAHRLAVQMEQLFCPPWNVDCEYDRDAQLKKLLDGIKGCDAEKKTNAIFPDIIVHHREQSGREHNLLVIELKKDASEDPCDLGKLKLLTDPNGYYKYQLGLYINVDGGNFTCTWYKDGERI